MDNESEELYLQKLEEFILDENKIVTVTWLCLQLGITADNARLLLEKYVQDHRNSKPNDLAITYLLSGLLEDDTLMIGIAKESEVQQRKETFKTFLNQQVYSVQKCELIDFVSLSLVDSFDVHVKKQVAIKGSIVSEFSIPRLLKTKAPPPSPPKQAVKAKPSFFKAAPPIDKPKIVEKVEESKPAGSPKKPSQSKKNGITNFFNRSNKKPDTSKSKAEDIVKMKVDVEKQPVLKPDDVTVDKLPVSKSNGVKLESKDIMKNLIDSDSDEELVSVKSEKSKENSKPKTYKNKKRQRKENKKNDPSPKRLKRIISQDSDSDDIFGNEPEPEESIDVIENSDEELKALKEIKPLAPKNKNKKWVDKTFNEDGYIVTRRELVEESGSDDESKAEELQKEIKVESRFNETKVKEEKVSTKVKEETVSNKSSANENGKKPAVSKTKGTKGKKVPAANQPTLMNFFKKN